MDFYYKWKKYIVRDTWRGFSLQTLDWKEIFLTRNNISIEEKRNEIINFLDNNN